MEDVGLKCHMNDITAAIGLVQLAKLKKMNNRRRYLAKRYTNMLADVRWIEPPVEKEYANSAWHNYVIKVTDPNDRNPLMEHLKTKGISTGMHYIPNHLYQMYRPFVSEALTVTETVWRCIITLPLFPDLTEEQQNMVVEEIRNYKKR